MRTKVQVPWPLGKDQIYDPGTGRWCFTGWHARHFPTVLPPGAVRLTPYEMNTLRAATKRILDLYPTELNDGSDSAFRPNHLSDDERCMVLCMGLYAAGYEPIVVDKDTAEPL